MQCCHLKTFFELAFSDIFDPPCVMRKYDAMLRFFPVGGHAEEEEGNGMREIYPSLPSSFLHPSGGIFGTRLPRSSSSYPILSEKSLGWVDWEFRVVNKLIFV